MGYGLINIWIREPDDCSVSLVKGFAWARACCSQKIVAHEPLENGHAELKVPPGCYIVDAMWQPGCCGTAKETIVIVRCNETVCANLIREWAGSPYKSLTAFAAHGAKAGIPEPEIKRLVDLLDKVGKTVPESKVRKYSEEELAIIEKVSDKEHKEILGKFRPILLRKG